MKKISRNDLLDELFRLLEIRFFRNLTDEEKLEQDLLIKEAYIELKEIKLNMEMKKYGLRS